MALAREADRLANADAWCSDTAGPAGRRVLWAGVVGGRGSGEPSVVGVVVWAGRVLGYRGPGRGRRAVAGTAALAVTVADVCCCR